jgi:hypothetical protein
MASITAHRSPLHGYVGALLGPTNTGKTHHAIERMLEHASGMIDLPLRLLAREVYDRVTARVGESRVALVTGEEQRIPPRPAYWVATVEAMPVERDVGFGASEAHRAKRLANAVSRLGTGSAYGGGAFSIWNSTRRLSRRPASVVFGPVGRFGPKPSLVSRSRAMP